MYTNFVVEDGMIVLHDICDYPAGLGYVNNVALSWNQLTREYETRAIIDDAQPEPGADAIQSGRP